MSPLRPSEEAASASSPTSHPTETSASKEPAKISCLACRAAKRRCQTTDAHTTCRRCSTQGLVCEYRKHNRGRKRKHPDEVDAARTMAFELGGVNVDGTDRRASARTQVYRRDLTEPGDTSLDLTGLLGGADGPDTPSTAQTGRHQLSTRAGTRPSPRLAHTPRLYTSLHQDSSTPPLSNASDPPRRVEIQFSHVIPVEGDSSPYMAGTGRSAPYPAPDAESSESRTMSRLLRQECPDPVTAGLLSELDAFDLFEYYFNHLNITLCILDPVLHTATSTRSKSPVLFSAVLTVAAKIRRPKTYAACLMISNKLLGQAVEFGLCSLELVQAIVLLTHWKKPDDGTSWRRVGYAIRMAQELRLNIKASRPLSKNEKSAREVLNRERAWLNLIIADYHLAIHHSLPRMIADEGIDDPTDWITEHPQLPCPGESTLAPWITFSRMCRLYADMLASMNGDQSNMRALAWIELEWKRWRAKWLDRSQEFGFLRPQVSTIRLCDSFYRFHIAEYTLLYNARYKSQGVLSMEEITPMSLAFAECIDAALAIGSVFQEDFVKWGFLPYCFNLVWVALAVSSVWLYKNIVLMSHIDRARVIKSLSDIQHSTEEASCSSDDMAAYTHRLAKHLLAGISPEWQISSLVSRQMEGVSDGTSDAGVNASVLNVAPNPPHGRDFDRPQGQTHWSPATVSQIIQDQLWNQGMALDHHDPNAFLGNDPMGHLLRGETDHQRQAYPDASHLENTSLRARDGPVVLQDELLFPAADDDFWRILFPDNAQPTLPSIM